MEFKGYLKIFFQLLFFLLNQNLTLDYLIFFAHNHGNLRDKIMISMQIFVVFTVNNGF